MFVKFVLCMLDGLLEQSLHELIRAHAEDTLASELAVKAILLAHLLGVFFEGLHNVLLKCGAKTTGLLRLRLLAKDAGFLGIGLLGVKHN